jgi:hypothetical protein
MPAICFPPFAAIEAPPSAGTRLETISHHGVVIESVALDIAMFQLEPKLAKAAVI